jgi:hypothetical protein
VAYRTNDALATSHGPMIAMNVSRSQLQPASSGGTAPGAARTPSTRAGAVVLAQLAAAAGYVASIFLGDVPDPFSFEDWAFMLLPPAVFAFLFVAGLFGVSSSGIAVWRRALSGLGSFVAACGLAVSLVLLPLNLFGSLMDYAIG